MSEITHPAPVVSRAQFLTLLEGDLRGFELIEFMEAVDARVDYLVGRIAAAEGHAKPSWDYTNQRSHCGKGRFDATWYKDTIGLLLTPAGNSTQHSDFDFPPKDSPEIHGLLIASSPARHIPTRYLFDDVVFESELAKIISKRHDWLLNFLNRDDSTLSLEQAEDALDEIQF